MIAGRDLHKGIRYSRLKLYNDSLHYTRTTTKRNILKNMDSEQYIKAVGSFFPTYIIIMITRQGFHKDLGITFVGTQLDQ